jgi:hypothetical protein
MVKDGWYDAGAGEFRHMADARDKVRIRMKQGHKHLFFSSFTDDFCVVVSSSA